MKGGIGVYRSAGGIIASVVTVGRQIIPCTCSQCDFVADFSYGQGIPAGSGKPGKEYNDTDKK
jgi:hypothetical protein